MIGNSLRIELIQLNTAHIPHAQRYARRWGGRLLSHAQGSGAPSLVVEMSVRKGWKEVGTQCLWHSEGSKACPQVTPHIGRLPSLRSGFFILPEPYQPSNGLYPDSSWNAGLGQHAVLG